MIIKKTTVSISGEAVLEFICTRDNSTDHGPVHTLSQQEMDGIIVHAENESQNEVNSEQEQLTTEPTEQDTETIISSTDLMSEQDQTTSTDGQNTSDITDTTELGEMTTLNDDSHIE